MREESDKHVRRSYIERFRFTNFDFNGDRRAAVLYTYLLLSQWICIWILRRRRSYTMDSASRWRNAQEIRAKIILNRLTTHSPWCHVVIILIDVTMYQLLRWCGARWCRRRRTTLRARELVNMIYCFSWFPCRQSLGPVQFGGDALTFGNIAGGIACAYWMVWCQWQWMMSLSSAGAVIISTRNAA